MNGICANRIGYHVLSRNKLKKVSHNYDDTIVQ